MLSTKSKIRIARALNVAITGARSAVGLDATAEVRRFGLNWRLDLNEGIDLAIYLGRYQNISNSKLKQWLQPGTLAIDIGANIGAHCLRMAKQVGSRGRVVGIEPTDYGFAKLRANALLNPELLQRLVLVQAALTDGSETDRKAAFYSRWPLRTNGVDRHAGHMGQLEAARGAQFTTLDALLDELRADGQISGPAAFVKLDVDGHELQVLRGGGETFGKQKPLVLIELAPYVQDLVPNQFEQLIETLKRYGYRLEDNASGHALPMSAAELRKCIRLGAGVDAIAKPYR